MRITISERQSRRGHKDYDVKGLTLRDLFAVAALAGSTASDANQIVHAKAHADFAYECADAMLAARDKKETP